MPVLLPYPEPGRRQDLGAIYRPSPTQNEQQTRSDLNSFARRSTHLNLPPSSTETDCTATHTPRLCPHSPTNMFCIPIVFIVHCISLSCAWLVCGYRDVHTWTKLGAGTRPMCLDAETSVHFCVIFFCKLSRIMAYGPLAF